MYSAVSQLSGYVDSDPSYRYGNTYDINILSDSFIIGLYKISYACENNGLIFYWFERLEPRHEKDPVLVPDPVPVEEKEKIKEINLKTAKVVVFGVTYDSMQS